MRYNMKILFSIFLGMIILTDKSYAAKNTEWVVNKSEYFCSFRGKNAGVELVISVQIKFDKTDYDSTFIMLRRPSFLNKFVNSNIHWPGYNEWDDDQVSFASFFSQNPTKMNLPLDMGDGGDLWTNGTKRLNTLRFSKNFISYKNVEIFTEYYTKTGYSTTRLGSWRAKTENDFKALNDFSNCLKR
jgi:hypothetical protein